VNTMKAPERPHRRQAPMDKLWQDNGAERASNDPALLIDVAGFEGPLDLLLISPATRRSICRVFRCWRLPSSIVVHRQRARIRIELAADYLVMAAWLAYLKSRLLIPQQAKDDGPSGEEMAATLAFRLKRLEAMREAASGLSTAIASVAMCLARGAPEHIPDRQQSAYEASLYDLLTAYASLRQRQAVTQVTIARRTVWSLTDARELLTRLIGEIVDWTALEQHLLALYGLPEDRVTAIASAFAASLELVREGKLEIRQEGVFSPIYLRRGPNHATLQVVEQELPA
jgi:segregation and condensation protein A